MALKLGRIPTITMPNINTDMLVDEVNARIDELNRTLYEIELEHAKQIGVDNNVPEYQNNLDLNDFRITNVGRSREAQDVVTRRELEEIGILGSRSGGLTLSGDVTIDGTLTLLGGGGGGAEVPTSGDVINIINNEIETNVATSNSGDVVDFENSSGGNGSTQGTLSMAVDRDGKAQFIRVTDRGLTVHDPDITTLLKLLLEEIKGLRNELKS